MPIPFPNPAGGGAPTQLQPQPSASPLGDVANGNQPTQPTTDAAVEKIANTNLGFLQNPQVRAGLLQLGVSLLTPGSSFGSAIGDAGGAARAYQQGQDQQTQQQRENERQEAEFGLRQEESAASQRNTDRAYDLQLQKLGLDKEQLSTLKQYQEAQIKQMGLKTDKTDEAIFDAAIKIYTTQLEGGALTGGDTSFNQDAFNQVLNGLRAASGKPALAGGGGGPTAALPIVDADYVQSALERGISPAMMQERLQGKFQLTPEAQAVINAAINPTAAAAPAAPSAPVVPAPQPIPGVRRGRHTTTTSGPQLRPGLPNSRGPRGVRYQQANPSANPGSGTRPIGRNPNLTR